MRTLLTGGRVWRADGSFVQNCQVLWEDGIIQYVGVGRPEDTADREIDARGLTVLPGLVDAHTHGRAGQDFSTADADAMRMMKTEYALRGVTTVIPTLASATLADWERSIAAIGEVGFDGVHLEGRYLNPAKRGAHAEHLLAPLDAAELDVILNKISLPCRISAALELDKDGSFAACALSHGAKLSLAHTGATADEAKLALSRGATSFSHLFNAMPPLHHRAGGAVAAALCSDAYAELIVDGVHVCADMIDLAYRCLGKRRTVLVTDSMEATGCPDGEYAIAGQPVTVTGGRALTAYGALAGSTLELWDAIKNLMRFASVPLSDAIACATVNPARMMGIYDRVGSIDIGKRADLILTDDTFSAPHTVIVCGEPISRKES